MGPSRVATYTIQELPLCGLVGVETDRLSQHSPPPLALCRSGVQQSPSRPATALRLLIARSSVDTAESTVVAAPVEPEGAIAVAPGHPVGLLREQFSLQPKLAMARECVDDDAIELATARSSIYQCAADHRREPGLEAERLLPVCSFPVLDREFSDFSSTAESSLVDPILPLPNKQTAPHVLSPPTSDIAHQSTVVPPLHRTLCTSFYL